MSNITQKAEWVDLCRGMGIFLVVLGHTMLSNPISGVYIYGFHMPLFFFISGLVSNYKKYSFKDFIKSRFNTLILPYVFFYLLTWIYWALAERHFRPSSMDWWYPLIGLFYGSQWKGFMDHNGVLWFLPCLFIVETMAFGILKYLKLNWAKVLSVASLCSLGFCIHYQLGLNMSMVCLPFFC